MASCIIPIVGGHVATVAPGTFLNKDFEKGNKGQLWVIEKEGNKLAFKSPVDGQYLRASSGAAYANIVLGPKQWWIAEMGQSPGLFWLKCTDFPDAYLCNAGASWNPNNKVYIWPRQQNWWHALQWYIEDANQESVTIGSGTVSEEQKAAIAKQEEQENALAERETALSAKLKDQEKIIADREQAIKTKEEQLTKRERDVVQRTTKPNDSSESSKATEAKLAELQRSIKEKDEAIKALETKMTAKDALKTDSAAPSAATPNGNSADSSSSGSSSQEIEQLKKELAEAKAATQPGASILTPRFGHAVRIPERKLPAFVKPGSKIPPRFIARSTVTSSQDVIDRASQGPFQRNNVEVAQKALDNAAQTPFENDNVGTAQVALQITEASSA